MESGDFAEPLNFDITTRDPEITMTEKSRFVTIKFTSGRQQRFEFAALSEDIHVALGKLEKMLASGYLMLKSEDRMQIIPLTNVESMVIMPVPDKLPALAVQVLNELE